MHDIADALAALTWEGGRIHRARTRLGWIVAAITWLGMIGAAVVLAWDIGINAMWHGVLPRAVPVALTFQLVLIPVRRLVSRNRERRGRIKADALRQAAAAGNDKVAPQVADSGTSAGEPATDGATYGPFQHATPQATAARVGPAIAFAMFGASGGAIGIVILLVALNRTGASGSPIDASNVRFWLVLSGALVIGGAILLVLAIIYGWQAWRLRGPVRIAADELGIRQVARGERRNEQTIAWHEVRAFFRIRVLRASLVTFISLPMLYVVDDGTRLVAWVVEDETRDGYNQQLCRLITTRTRLSLRDITTAAGRLTDAPSPARQLLARSNGLAESSILPLGVTLPRIWTRGVVATVLTPFLVAALVAGLAWAAPYVEPLAYRPLVTRIHAETPLFHDALDHDNGRWPVHTSSPDGTRYVFAKGGYEVTGIFSSVTTPDAYGDAAVEVTVGQPDGNAPDGAVGLAVRQVGDSGTNVLFVLHNGTWSISQGPGIPGGDLNFIYDEPSAAIHTGPGATNQLLLVMRGHHYWCFINRQLVGGYAQDTLSSGYMGLFVSDGATGLFTNLTIYPAPS